MLGKQEMDVLQQPGPGRRRLPTQEPIQGDIPTLDLEEPTAVEITDPDDTFDPDDTEKRPAVKRADSQEIPSATISAFSIQSVASDIELPITPIPPSIPDLPLSGETPPDDIKFIKRTPIKYQNLHIPGTWMRQWAYLSGTLMTLALVLAMLVPGSVYLSDQPALHKPHVNTLLRHSTAHPHPPVSADPPTSVVTAQGDWPTYMADNGRSGFNGAETIITPQTAPHLKLKWIDKAGGYPASQPVEANGLVYWGAWDGFEYATDLNGHKVWATNLGTSEEPTCVTPHLGVSSTATIASVKITGKETLVDFVGGGDGTLYALDAHTGAIIWKTLLGTPPEFVLWSSPALYRGSIYIGISSPGDCPLTPGYVFKLNPATGSIQHTFNLVPKGCTGAGVWSSPTIDEEAGTIYITTANAGSCSSFERFAVALVELRASDLSLIHSWQVPKSEQTGDGDFGATATLFTTGTGIPMVGVENKNGKYYAFKRGDLSKPVWKARIATGRGSLSSSAWDGHRIYVAGRSIKLHGVHCHGSLAALDPDTGALIWQDCLKQSLSDAPLTNPVGGPVTGAVAAVPGLVVYGQGASMMVFDAASGEILFSYQDTNPGALFRGWASISHGVLYMGNTDGRLFAFAPQ